MPSPRPPSVSTSRGSGRSPRTRPERRARITSRRFPDITIGLDELTQCRRGAGEVSTTATSTDAVLAFDFTDMDGMIYNTQGEVEVTHCATPSPNVRGHVGWFR